MSSSPVSYFLRYAFSCAQVLRDQNQMTEAEYERIYQAALRDEEIPLPELERLFPAAFRRLNIIAKREGKPIYDEKIIKEYFPQDHNDFIDKGDGTYGQAPKWFCELCKVKQVNVLETKTIENQLFLKVDKNRWVQSPFFKAIVGDIVVIHHNYAVETV